MADPGGDSSTPPSVFGLLTDRVATVVDADYLVEHERLVLSPAEIRCVERAASVTEAGLRAAVGEAERTAFRRRFASPKSIMMIPSELLRLGGREIMLVPRTS